MCFSPKSPRMWETTRARFLPMIHSPRRPGAGERSDDVPYLIAAKAEGKQIPEIISGWMA
jgi:hypothetical protein